MSETQERKRRKKEKVIDPNRCEFIIEKKKRRCGMRRQKGASFCLDHLKNELGQNGSEDQRIPCPLDPKHSVWSRRLKVHLNKCNARPVEVHDPWYEANYNTRLRSDEGVEKDSIQEPIDNQKITTFQEDIEMFNQVISALQTYSKSIEPVPEMVRQHPGLDSWMEAKQNKKHILQQSSMAGILKELGLLSSENLYMEFGCGKGELSRIINTCILSDKHASQKTYGFGLIDRGANRMKVDNKILQDCENSELQPVIKRSRIDIEHLVVDKFLESSEPTSVVAVSKHLCGVATDLTLKCLLNLSTTIKRLKGLVVAMCCRQVCNYEQLLTPSKKYLAQHGIKDAEHFSVLKKVVTWAVCGTTTDHELSNGQNKEDLGLLARTMIDNSRVFTINKMMPEFTARLVKYAEKNVTSENHCLQMTRRSQN